MHSGIRRSTAVVCAVLACALSAWGGPNADVVVTVDQNASTAKVEAVCAHQGIPSTVLVAVLAEGLSEATGYMVRLSFDSTMLKFEKAELVGAGEDQKPLLESNGGELGPVLVKSIDGGTVDVAAGVKSAKGVGVSGSGLLVCARFTRIGDDDCSVSVAKAEFSDADLTIDQIAVK